jgi:hypothetical protein
MIDILWKLLFKKAGCTAESIAEIERQITADVNRYDKYC